MILTSYPTCWVEIYLSSHPFDFGWIEFPSGRIWAVAIVVVVEKNKKKLRKNISLFWAAKGGSYGSGGGGNGDRKQ